MKQIAVRVIAAGSESFTDCSCCGRPIYSGCGDLLSDSGPVASFWYRWSDGHGGQYVLGIGRFTNDGAKVPGVAVISATLKGKNIAYSIVEPENSPWMSLGDFGGPMSRNQINELGFKSELFHIVDAIAANEPRISSRMLACMKGPH